MRPMRAPHSRPAGGTPLVVRRTPPPTTRSGAASRPAGAIFGGRHRLSLGLRRLGAVPVPGPVALGRGVVINAGDAIPAPWMSAPVVTIDEAVLQQPAAGGGRAAPGVGRARSPVVVELAVDPARFREPASITDEPWSLDADVEPWFDRLHFLVWANTYDARSGDAHLVVGPQGGPRRVRPTRPTAPADVVLPGGVAGLDRRRSPPAVGPGRRSAATAVVHSETVELGRVDAAPPPVDAHGRPGADQLAAVAHLSGPARVIAPAGSGKTRVLTERLRHLLGRPRLGARGRPGRGLQQGGPARAGAAHRGVPAPGPHAQLARALGPGPAPRPLARGCSRSGSAGASSSRCCPAGAASGPTPTPSVPTSRRSAWSGWACARPRRGRGVRATTSTG